jgi:succinate-semialdehyde dehydrogenase / glutarate-semialdehyde dehydrogenase
MKLNDATLLKERCYVGGEWIGEPSDPVNNPATGETIARVPRFGAVETTDAIQKAERAFPAWSRKTAKERSVLLRRWFDLMIANKEDIALLMTSEQGKPLAESRGEVEYAAAFIEYYAEEAKRIYGETIPSHRPTPASW